MTVGAFLGLVGLLVSVFATCWNSYHWMGGYSRIGVSAPPAPRADVDDETEPLEGVSYRTPPRVVSRESAPRRSQLITFLAGMCIGVHINLVLAWIIVRCF